MCREGWRQGCVPTQGAVLHEWMQARPDDTCRIAGTLKYSVTHIHLARLQIARSQCAQNMPLGTCTCQVGQGFGVHRAFRRGEECVQVRYLVREKTDRFGSPVFFVIQPPHR